MRITSGEVMARSWRNQGPRKRKTSRNARALPAKMTITLQPASKAAPAAPVKVQALNICMNALAPTSHQVPRQPLRK